MTVLVLGEVCEKMVEADGFGMKVNFGLAKVRDTSSSSSTATISPGALTTRTTGAFPTSTELSSSTAGDKLPPPTGERVAKPLATAGSSRRRSDDVRDVVFNYHLNPHILWRHKIGLQRISFPNK